MNCQNKETKNRPLSPLLRDPIRNCTCHEAIRLDPASVAASFDPADQLRDQLAGLALCAVSRIDVNGNRAIQVHLLVFLLALHDLDQLLRDLQAVICLLVKLSTHIFDDRLLVTS